MPWAVPDIWRFLWAATLLAPFGGLVMVALGAADGDGFDDDELPPVIRPAHPLTKAKITPTISGPTITGPTHVGILPYHGFGVLVADFGVLVAPGWLVSLSCKTRPS